MWNCNGIGSESWNYSWATTSAGLKFSVIHTKGETTHAVQFLTAGKRCHLTSVINICDSKKGDIMFRAQGNVRAWCWKDIGEVHVFSSCTFHLWRETSRKLENLWSLCDTHNGYIDLGDRIADSCGISRWTRRWMKKPLLCVIPHHSGVIRCLRVCGRNMTHLKCRE
jgi:hypothetical protein